MFNSLKSTLKKGISVAAQVADTGIFEGVPIVSNVLCACTYINEQIEASDAQDEKLQEVRDLLDSVSPIVGKLGASVNQFSNDQAMKSNLKAMSGTMEELWGKVDEYMRSHAVVQQIKIIRDWLTKKSDKAIVDAEVKTCESFVYFYFFTFRFCVS